MGRMEVIIRIERRRRYSDEECGAVLAQCDEPGATVVGVSHRLGISASLNYGWPKTRREAERIASERAIAVHSLWRGCGCCPAWAGRGTGSCKAGRAQVRRPDPRGYATP